MTNKSKSTYIKDITDLKHGVRDDNTEWTLWLVSDADNDRYTTFEPMLLGKAMESGQEVVIHFTEESSGKMNKAGTAPLMNRSITKVEVSKVIPDEFIARLAKVEAILRSQGHEL